MHLQSCEHPKRIYNQYLKEYMYIPCGKCNTCLNRRSLNWVNRLKQESSCHEYTVFFTLTYDELHVPYMQYVPDDTKVFQGVRTSFDLYFKDMEDCYNDNQSIALFRHRSFRVLNKKDIQNFIKRLRSQIYEKFKNSKKGVPFIRYYVAGEYGPTTLRPHYHGLLWFDSQSLASCFDELFNKAWSEYNRVEQRYVSFGRTDWSFVKSSAASYVAQYVNCFSHLPKVLTFPAFRPFSLCSRRPPIGSLFESSESLRKIFYQGLTKTCIPQGEGKAATFAPLLPSIKNRLFPKCHRFSSLSHDMRVTVYSIAGRFHKGSFERPSELFESRENFEKVIKKEVTSLFDDWKQIDLLRYFSLISYDFKDWKPIFRAFDISWRVLNQASIFGVSIDYYVRKIEQFYVNCDYSNLKSCYEFQQEYSKTHDTFELVSLDLEFLNNYAIEPSRYFKIAESYGLSSSPSYTDLLKLCYDRSHDYKALVATNHKIFTDNSKTKQKNDYLIAHPEKSLF